MKQWRPWLYASLPILFECGALLGLKLLERAPEPQSSGGMQFTLEEVNVYIPLSVLLLAFWTVATAPILSVRFFRWGKYGRTSLGTSLLLVALPWLLGSMVLAFGWRFNTLSLLYLAGAGGLATVSGGLAENLFAQAATAIATSALLASLLAVLGLEVVRLHHAGTRSGSPEPETNQRRRLLVVGVLALASAACAGLASHAGVQFFERIAREGLEGWSTGNDDDAIRWAGFHGAQLLLALGVLIGLLLSFVGRTKTLSAGAAGLLALLVVAQHGAHFGTQQYVFAELTSFLGAGDSVASRSLAVTGDGYVYRALKPALSLGGDGLYLSGVREARWDEGLDHVQRWLAAHLARRSLEVDGERAAPSSLALGLDASATLSSVRCFAEAARRTGALHVDLATGPELELPDRARRALTFVAPVLGSAFSRRVSTTPLRLSAGQCLDYGAKQRRSHTLGSRPPQRLGDVDLQNPDWRCISVSLSPEATLDDLLAFLHGDGSNSTLSFEGEFAANVIERECPTSVQP